MDRTQQRCLIGSTAGHVLVLILVLAGSGLAAKKVIQPDVPFLEIIPTDLKLTMGDQIGGGTPTPRPLAEREGTPPPPVEKEPAPVTPPPAVPKTEIKPVEPVKPVAPPKTAEPEKKVVEPAKVERKVEVAREVKSVATAQDLDPSRKADKPVEKPRPSVSKIQVSKQTRTRTAEDRAKLEKAAAEAKAAREAEQAAAEARERRYAAAQSLASRLTGAAQGVAKNVGGSTQIEMPGPGGAAYAPYLSWLQTFLYQQWRRPSSTTGSRDWVGLEVVIAKDGTVLSAEIKRSSGVPAIDASAEEVFRRNRKLRPLPDEYKEPRLVVPVKFVLEASASP
jgi:TonB family protein